ncbi:MAG: bifunctional phosphoribosyl-AMP cyclohydrolase/phosphoribosyl-ATP diphosphatase HisIE [Eubacteriales bacterium]
MKDFLKNIEKIKFNEKGLVAVVTQDVVTGAVLMQAWMNRESIEATVKTGKMTYFSRSRNTLWIKGETSGNFQYVKKLLLDCDKDTILALVEQVGNACHTGSYTCFGDGNYEVMDIKDGKYAIIDELFDVIKNRKVNKKEGSYTNYLFEKGLDKILKKVGEESAEVIIAAKNLSKDEVRYEAADLTYHVLVLLAELDMQPKDILAELRQRR